MKLKQTLVCLLIFTLAISLCACSDTATLKCRSCQTEYKQGATFCSGCGEKLIATPTVCSCGVENSAGAKFCSACGKALGEASGSTDDNTGTVTDTNSSTVSDTTPADGTPADATHAYETPVGTETPADTTPDTNQSNNSSAVQQGSAKCSICRKEGLDNCQGHTCRVCSGIGSSACAGCHGTGQSAFEINGSRTCRVCYGVGRQTCPNCGGAGKKFYQS